MKIAVIGSGISGLGAAHFLSKKYKVDLFEKEDHFGGHAYTVEIPIKKTKNFSNLFNYFVRFHIYPGAKVVKTIAGNSVLISLSNGEGWKLLSETNNFKIEKNIFLGNKNKIINNESISISGRITAETTSIKWTIEKVN